jgi:hypothetical protein
LVFLLVSFFASPTNVLIFISSLAHSYYIPSPLDHSNSDLVIDGRIILKAMLKKEGLRMLIGLIWFGIWDELLNRRVQWDAASLVSTRAGLLHKAGMGKGFSPGECASRPVLTGIFIVDTEPLLADPGHS